MAERGITDLDPTDNWDRNLVNRGVSEPAGNSPNTHSKSTSQLPYRVGHGPYIYREPDMPMEVALVHEKRAPTEVWQKRPRRRRGIELEQEGV